MDLSRPWVLRGLVIALALVVGAIVYMAAGGGGDGEEPVAEPQAAGARILSEEELADAASTADHPVYWAGPIPDTELELSEEDGRVLVRYLQEGDEVGTAFGRRLAVGSYALPNPRKALDNFAKTPGATVEKVPDIGRVVISPEAQKNVYFVDPDNEVQVEVYAPSAKRAIDLVRSGRVQPVG